MKDVAIKLSKKNLAPKSIFDSLFYDFVYTSNYNHILFSSVHTFITCQILLFDYSFL